jgi:hypothetical protein
MPTYNLKLKIENPTKRTPKLFCFFIIKNQKPKSERKWSWKNTKNNFASLQLQTTNLKVKESEAKRTPKTILLLYNWKLKT